MNIDYFILVADAGVLILFLAVFFENTRIIFVS